ncbi:MAG TPA: hypothetical protein VMS88_05330, partial [Terriglobales bacterium]|nr:hypothetical protein [Terriglobales bacterium]
ERPPCLEWHVNFADPELFVAYGSGLLAQDEMQVAEHPVLACVREALLADGRSARTVEHSRGTPILVRGAERRIEISTDPDASAGRPAGLYGGHFAAAPLSVIRRAVRRIDPPTISHIVAIAAPYEGRGAYTLEEIAYAFVTACSAFAAIREESRRTTGTACRTAVHTGFWGCGVLGGDRRLMVALQALAARSAGIDTLVLHAGPEPGPDEARAGLEVADLVTQACGPSCAVRDLARACAELGFRWGVGDGN